MGSLDNVLNVLKESNITHLSVVQRHSKKYCIVFLRWLVIGGGKWQSKQRSGEGKQWFHRNFSEDSILAGMKKTQFGGDCG